MWFRVPSSANAKIKYSSKVSNIQFHLHGLFFKKDISRKYNKIISLSTNWVITLLHYHIKAVQFPCLIEIYLISEKIYFNGLNTRNFRLRSKKSHKFFIRGRRLSGPKLDDILLRNFVGLIFKLGWGNIWLK